ncbi:MAG TPA: response regulator [Thermomicrobiales bacterium]
MSEQQRSVLVVEDDVAIRDLLIDVLADEGYTVRSAGDGEEALAILDDWQPALIILDQLMPRMDGAAFRAAQQARPAIATIPTILLSATRNLSEQARSLDIASTIAKPFNLDELLQLAGELIDAAEDGSPDHAETSHLASPNTPLRRDAAGDEALRE